MKVELKPEEHAVLVELLTHELAELGPEIRHTDDRNYREDLKLRKQLIRRLLERLQVLQEA